MKLLLSVFFYVDSENGGGDGGELPFQVLRIVTEGAQQACPLLLLIKVFSRSPGRNGFWALSPRETCSLMITHSNKYSGGPAGDRSLPPPP